MGVRIRRVGLIVSALIVIAGACGDDDDDGGNGGAADTGAVTTGDTATTTGDTGGTEATAETGATDTEASEETDGAAEAASLTVATPFPSAIVFPDLYAADGRGYFEDENLDVTIEPLDGSGAALQAVESGAADVALVSPGPLMQAVERGSDFVSVFTAYQDGIFSLVTLEDSDVSSIEDLSGTTVGVGALDGGETPVVKSMLAAAGLQEGEDYELLAVGDGGTAAGALEGGDISAYGAAFIDVLIMEAGGFTTTDLTPSDFEQGGDSMYVFSGDAVENDPALVERFGRALARGMQWATDNPADSLELSCQVFPEECEDQAFAEQILDEVLAFTVLPDAAEGQWGFQDLEANEVFAQQLVDQGELTEPPDIAAIFNNDFLDTYNDFDPAEL
jgi:NitT/TauT family transport system substrate-binding protein